LDAVLAGYQQAFKNESAHLPEVALGYLILLITSESPLDEIQLFANQIRLQQNEQREEKLNGQYFKNEYRSQLMIIEALLTPTFNSFVFTLLMLPLAKFR
jgi:hypothetical protein